MAQVAYLTVTISSGQSLSPAINTGGGLLVGIQMPASWTSADLTFQGSFDGTTYTNLYDSLGTEITAAAAASRGISALNSSVFAAFNFVKIRSGTSGAAVNQAADRIITLAFL